MANRKSNNHAGGAAEKINHEVHSYDWRHYLKQHPLCKAAPPSSFEHVPYNKEWKNIGVKGYKIEVALMTDELPKYCEAQDQSCVFWIANTLKFCGYMSKIVYDGAEHIPKQYRDQLSTRWINFVTEAKRVGFTTMHSLSIMPPKCMETDKLEHFDWRDYIFQKLVQKHSIPTVVTTNGELIPKYKSNLALGHTVEVLDKSCISRMRQGKIIELVGGRVHVRYWDSKLESGKADFVCHEKSPTIFPPGWCQTVGHELSAPQHYESPTLRESTILSLIDYDNMPKISITVGMRLEAVDPLNPGVIAAATVQKVLNYGYVMVAVDGQNAVASFCYHITSPLIFPCGFSQKRGIELTPPKDYKGSSESFSWDTYLPKVQAEALPISGLRRDDTTNHGIKVGMKLEAVDIMEPNLICVATVNKVIGRLLKVGFDGWGNEYDQWMDLKSPDLFPIGWCEMNRYSLQHPPNVKPTPDNTIIYNNDNANIFYSAINGHNNGETDMDLTD